MGIFKKRTKEIPFLALDVGSEYIKAVIFKVKEDKVYVLGYGKHSQGPLIMSEGVIADLSQVRENCELAIAQASLQAGVRPSQVLVGISGELVKGYTAIIQFERANPEVKISDKEIKNVIEKVQNTAYENSLQKFQSDLHNTEVDIKLINAALTHLMIDGERVDDPLGFKGKRVQIGVLNIYAPLVQLSNLQKLTSSLELDLMAICALPYVVSEALSSENDLDFSPLVIDIGGSTTDVIAIQNQEVVAAKMFGMGGETVTTEIKNTFEIPFDEAEELKTKYIKKELEDEKQLSRLEKAIDRGLSYWKVGLKVALSEILNSDYAPKQILLTGGGSQMPQVKAMIAEIVHSFKSQPEKTPEFVLLTPQYLKSVIDETGSLENTQEVVPLCLALKGLEMTEEETVLDSALKKGIKE